jgi:hypothetical protein
VPCVCVGEESESHLLLKCPETQIERGVPEEQVASYQQGNCTQEDPYW